MSTETPDENAGPMQIATDLYAFAAAVVRRMPRDISLTATSTLSSLERLGPQRLTDLAAREGVTQPSMTALITRLQQAGLVERRGDPGDGRVVLVVLTPAGERYMRERRHVGARTLAPSLKELCEEQLDALRSALPALRALSGAEPDANRPTAGAAATGARGR